MKIITMKNVSGKSLTVDLPETLKEWKLSNKLAVEAAYNDMRAYIHTSFSGEVTPKPEILLANYTRFAIEQVVSAINSKEVTKEFFWGFPLGGNSFEDALEKHFKKKRKPKSTETVYHSVMTLCRYFDTMLESYTYVPVKRENAKFEYKGRVFIIPNIYINKLSGQEVTSNLTTRQVVECSRVEAFLTDKRTSEENKNDIFSAYLRMFAVLLHEEGGEEAPINPDEYEAWISERMLFFSDIDVQTALDVTFFLGSICLNSEKEKNTNTSLMTRQRKLKLQQQRLILPT